MNLETLNKIIKQLENTVSQDATRYHLGCVEITKDLIQSTDGHIMVRNKIQDEALKNIDKAYIHRDMLPYLKSVAKLHKRMSIVLSECGVHTITIDGKLVTEKDKIKYPNLDQFVPKHIETASIGIDANLLYKLVETLKVQKRQHCKLTFKVTTNKSSDGRILNFVLDNCSPFQVTTGTDDLGIIMPVRI
jgi:DNA polymerase III sliding clamp (beta) subunit (PCNA family)